MILIVKNSDKKDFFVPKHTDSDGIMCLTLKNNITNEEFEFNVEDEDYDENFYHLEIDLKDLENGEYTYIIGDSKGLLRIREEKEEETKVNNRQEYTQYHGF